MKQKIAVVGSGPIRIGQGIEFDYGCVHAAGAIQDLGHEAIIINNNPETVSTDFDTSDRLYFDPLTLESVSEILLTRGCQWDTSPVRGPDCHKSSNPTRKRTASSLDHGSGVDDGGDITRVH